MKKLLVVLMVLTIATVANAALVITGAPTGPINPSDNVTLGISANQEPSPSNMYLFLTNNLGTLSGGSVLWSDYSTALGEMTLHTGAGDSVIDYINSYPEYGSVNQAYYISLVGNTLPALVMDGAVVGDITFHSEAAGEVTLVLGNVVDDGTGVFIMQVFDSQVIQQGNIPEPMTLGLLGLGGLFLRRRK